MPELHRYGFISLDRNPLTRQGVCIAVVSLADADLTKYYIDKIQSLSANPDAVAEEAIRVNALWFGIDAENYEWLDPAWHKEVDRVFDMFPGRRGHIPMLRVVERDKDSLIRQSSVLQTPLKKKLFSFALSVTQAQKSDIERQNNLVADAVAGAVQCAATQRDTVLFALEQKNKPQPKAHPRQMDLTRDSLELGRQHSAECKGGK